MTQFEAGERDFMLDGRPVRLLSGAMHYFRVHEAQWDHRLAMLRAMGLNCVETYVPWNLHEPRPGEFRDPEALGRFLDAVRAAGLWAIVRPGPYICAEWENGGLPQWLTGPLGRRVRTRDAAYLRAVDAWFARLLPQVVARQCTAAGPGGAGGGPVIMVQAENEYGSYGSDGVYLAHLVERLRALGVRVPLFTSDGPEDHMLSGGAVPGLPATVNFGAGAGEALAALRRRQARGPLMCMEFWCGWFAHWGQEQVPRAPEDAAAALREILECGASVNVYMAHGGTNFGGWAGANRAGALHDGALRPTVTSYDYGAPVDERGRPTEKFWRFREVLAAWADGPLPRVPEPLRVLAEPVRAVVGQWACAGDVMEVLGGAETEGGAPATFEELGVDRGVVRYRVEVPGPRGPRPLRVRGLRDRAVVWVDGVRGPVVDTEDAVLGEVAGPASVELWVASLGRVNYGPRLGESKGITGGLLHERQFLHGVRSRGLRLDAMEDAGALARVPFRAAEEAGGAAGLYRGTVTVAGRPGDADLALPGWRHGFAWINGFCLGRYWDLGPQRTLYVPGPVLREGANELLLWEWEGAPALVGDEAGAPGLYPCAGGR
ncbi:beta-galactosidase [Streptomyces sp. 2112.3]|uniref:beta-galactosidase n=1 Tax=unclassified Streptomyces TaxID=2593676 RepID=UPI00087F392A|nr:beta-galactosidase/beta-galactosidase [Streptomyces sp. 2321.6]SDR52901.1 beta-galactosidase/beta-galactosidase [Streptomyces sp. KS_16]SEC32388.1 beta-galactosidase/beta-galactosidase [Streptomyces sp. 2133.1]SEF04824.1 beta-galactosidase/beta-galactosidase [Streptomyces sp. 2112.3]SNC66630.1 beta-galactosidase/beta-galactosidase [Streptomyces sp. 2114.4]